jgi:hypothetical protein
LRAAAEGAISARKRSGKRTASLKLALESGPLNYSRVRPTDEAGWRESPSGSFRSQDRGAAGWRHPAAPFSLARRKRLDRMNRIYRIDRMGFSLQAEILLPVLPENPVIPVHFFREDF